VQVLLISNPRSGRNRRDPGRVRRLQELLPPGGVLHQPEDLGTLRGLAAETDADVVAVDGGDGTLHKVLSAFLAVRQRDFPAFSLLRGGSMNTVARNLGIRASPFAQLRRLTAGAPRTVERRPLLVDGAQVGFFFGTGVLARFLKAYYAEGVPGPARAAQTLAQTVGSALVGGSFAREMFAPVPCRVDADDERFGPPEWSAVAAGMLPDLGLGFRPFYRAPERPGHMHVVGYSCSPAAVALSMPRIWMGRSPARPDIIERLAQRLVIEADEAQGYMLDGDFLQGGRRLVVSPGPILRFVTG